MRRKWHSSRMVSVVVSLLAASVWAGVPQAVHAAFTPIASGDLIASLGNGSVNEYTPSGTLVQTLMTGIKTPTGSAFDGHGNLYVTEFFGNDIRRLDATTGAVTVFSNNTILADGTSYNSPESIAFSSGFTKMYVSDANRFRTGGGIHVVDASTGKGLDFLPISSSLGIGLSQGESDWLAFNASNNLYMTNENRTQGVMQVNLTTRDIVSPSFVPNLPNVGYAISFDKNGNLWVGTTDRILEYSPSGVLLKTITNPGVFNTVFAAVFNPAGDTFYAGDGVNGKIYTYDLNGTLQGTFSAGLGVDGLSVAGARLANQPSIKTSLSDGGQSGANITVNAGTPVHDSATLTNATATAGGTVTYNVYSDNACKVLVAGANGGTKTVTNGVVLDSDPVTLTTTGTFYWVASYSGDANNAASNSGCGAETETVVEGLIKAQGTTFSAIEGNPFTATVATFTDPDTSATAAEYSATIDWGDGTPLDTSATIGGSGGSFTVNGSHTYVEERLSYTVTVTIIDRDNLANNTTVTSTANVADAALTASPACSTNSQLSYNGPTATFTDAASPFGGTLSDFTATIDWGDGSISPADGQHVTISGPIGGVYTVSGIHTYATTGNQTIKTTITDVGGSTASTSCNTLAFSFAPGGGSFVIGDNNAVIGNSVTFWGAQWAKDNSLSGGSAPRSFKGFAENPTTPSCFAAWSADPGNSTPPPDGPLPAFMGVIVTSSADKSGSTISGNTVSIVIVQTNPGYAPNPGHAGTGTVVAMFCP